MRQKVAFQLHRGVYETWGEDQRCHLSDSETMSSRGTEAPGELESVYSSLDLEEDTNKLVEECQPEDLMLMESAIVRLLREENSQRRLPRRNLYVRDSESDNALEPNDPQHEQRNDDILKKLLQQVFGRHTNRGAVKVLRYEKRLRVPDSLRYLGSKGRHLYDRNGIPEQEAGPPVTERTLKAAVEAAAHAAMAAAQAAQAAALAASENSAVIEPLVSMLTSGPRTGLYVNNASEHLEVTTNSNLDVDNQVGSQALHSSQCDELAKVVQKQNRLTHWILGFMVVTTAIWRFGTVSFVTKLQKKISNPIECIQTIFGGDKDESQLPKSHKIPGFNEVASMLQVDPQAGKPGILPGLNLEGLPSPLQQGSGGMFSMNHLLSSHSGT